MPLLCDAATCRSLTDAVRNRRSICSAKNAPCTSRHRPTRESEREPRSLSRARRFGSAIRFARACRLVASATARAIERSTCERAFRELTFD
jgi:hypothetical protein